MATVARRLKTTQIAGQVLIAVVVIGLAILVYWIVTERPGARYPGIEKLRGGQDSLHMVPPQVV